MEDINFIPSDQKRSGRSRGRRDASEPGSVEYTAGGAAPQLVPQAADQQPKPKKEKRSFLLWRRQKKDPKPTPPIAVKTTPPVEVGHDYITLNPGHAVEPDPVLPADVPEVIHEAIHSTPPQPAPPTQPVMPSSPPPPVEPEPMPTPPPQPKPTPEPVRTPEKITPPKKIKQPKQRKRKKHKSHVMNSFLNVGVNLIPHATDTNAARNPVQKVVYTGISCVVLVLCALGAMQWYQHSLQNDTRALYDEITALKAESATYSTMQKQAALTHMNIESAQSVLQKHVYWSPLLNAIEELTLSTVRYDSMTATAQNGQVILDTVAPHYTDIESQVRVFRQSPLVKKVEVTSATATTTQGATDTAEEPQSVTFVMTVDFDPSLFYSPDANTTTQP